MIDNLATCNFCMEKNFTQIFNLGTIPLGYPIENSNSDDIWSNELEIILCDKCLLAQTVQKVPPSKLTSENYYVSEKAKLISEHDTKLVSDIIKQFSLNNDSLILEIGSGDGSFLEIFRKHGFTNVIGIEPAIHFEKKHEFEVIKNFFNSEVIQHLVNTNKIPDVIIANYIIELVPDLNDFFSNLTKIMKKNSIFIMEVPYLNDFLKSFRLDGFAHLRCNWFTMNAIINIFKKLNLHIIDIQHHSDYRGGTLRVIVKKENSFNDFIKADLIDVLNKEKIELDTENNKILKEKIAQLKNSLRTQIHELQNKQMKIIGYGAGLKASTLINWLNLDNGEIEFVVDSDPNKQFKNIPGTKISIKPLNELNAKNEKIAVIILAYDHVKEIESFLHSKLPNGSKIVKLLPKFSAELI